MVLDMWLGMKFAHFQERGIVPWINMQTLSSKILELQAWLSIPTTRFIICTSICTAKLLSMCTFI